MAALLNVIKPTSKHSIVNNITAVSSELHIFLSYGIHQNNWKMGEMGEG